MLRTGCWNNVRLLNVSSEILSPGWKHEIELLWIDGDHRYEATKSPAIYNRFKYLEPMREAVVRYENHIVQLCPSM